MNPTMDRLPLILYPNVGGAVQRLTSDGNGERYSLHSWRMSAQTCSDESTIYVVPVRLSEHSANSELESIRTPGNTSDSNAGTLQFQIHGDVDVERCSPIPQHLAHSLAAALSFAYQHLSITTGDDGNDESRQAYLTVTRGTDFLTSVLKTKMCRAAGIPHVRSDDEDSFEEYELPRHTAVLTGSEDHPSAWTDEDSLEGDSVPRHAAVPTGSEEHPSALTDGDSVEEDDLPQPAAVPTGSEDHLNALQKIGAKFPKLADGSILLRGTEDGIQPLKLRILRPASSGDGTWDSGKPWHPKPDATRALGPGRSTGEESDI